MGLNGHVFDYGESCKKIELDAGFHYPSKDFVSGTYYIKCDAVDCCYGGDGVGSRPDVKKWDINKPGFLTQVKYVGLKDTTELNGKPVRQAEVWQELDKLPFTKGLEVTYDYTSLVVAQISFLTASILAIQANRTALRA